MKLRPLTRSEVRSIDSRALHEYHVPGLILMENAGRGAAHVLAQYNVQGRIAVCIGKGNNGGDGLVMARHLQAWGLMPHVYVTTTPSELHGDTLANYRIAEAAGIPMTTWTQDSVPSDIRDCEWIVDGLVGTGLHGVVRHFMANKIDAINNLQGQRLALDIPSGLDCDTGEPLGSTIRASATVTMVARKQGFDNPNSVQYTGRVITLDIGVPLALLQEFVLAPDESSD